MLIGQIRIIQRRPTLGPKQRKFEPVETHGPWLGSKNLTRVTLPEAYFRTLLSPVSVQYLGREQVRIYTES